MNISRRLSACLWAGLLFAPLATGAGAAPTTQPAVTRELRKRIFDLNAKVQGSDPAAALAAMRELATIGEPARSDLYGGLRRWLTRDKAAIESRIRQVGKAEQVAAAQAQLDERREQARENIAKLAKDDTLRLAHEHYEELAKLRDQLNTVYTVRLELADALTRRAALLELWAQVAKPTDPAFPADKEEKLKADGLAALGLSLEDLTQIGALGNGKGPADRPAWHLWFYKVCRQIDAYNQTIRPVMQAEEWENLVLLNAYRESLGILPYEADPRLVQAARRHSKEMVDLGYFAHDSPTPSEKSHVDRMRNAGYKAGYSENIYMGSSSGEKAFWAWFDSPGHHKNMVEAGSTQAGVGRWQSMWTQNFGRGARVMDLPPEERAKAIEVQGEILPPYSGPDRTPRRTRATPTPDKSAQPPVKTEPGQR